MPLDDAGNELTLVPFANVWDVQLDDIVSTTFVVTSADGLTNSYWSLAVDNYDLSSSMSSPIEISRCGLISVNSAFSSRYGRPKFNFIDLYAAGNLLKCDFDYMRWTVLCCAFSSTPNFFPDVVSLGRARHMWLGVKNEGLTLTPSITKAIFRRDIAKVLSKSTTSIGNVDLDADCTKFLASHVHALSVALKAVNSKYAVQLVVASDLARTEDRRAHSSPQPERQRETGGQRREKRRRSEAQPRSEQPKRRRHAVVNYFDDPDAWIGAVRSAIDEALRLHGRASDAEIVGDSSLLRPPSLESVPVVDDVRYKKLVGMIRRLQSRATLEVDHAVRANARAWKIPDKSGSDATSELVQTFAPAGTVVAYKFSPGRSSGIGIVLDHVAPSTRTSPSNDNAVFCLCDTCVNNVNFETRVFGLAQDFSRHVIETYAATASTSGDTKKSQWAPKWLTHAYVNFPMSESAVTPAGSHVDYYMRGYRFVCLLRLIRAWAANDGAPLKSWRKVWPKLTTTECPDYAKLPTSQSGLSKCPENLRGSLLAEWSSNIVSEEEEEDDK